MALRIIRLEERIVLEGSGIDHDDDGGAFDATAVDLHASTPDPSADAGQADPDRDAAQASAESPAEPKQDPVDSNSMIDTTALLDGTGEIQDASHTYDPVRVMVVSSGIADADTLAAAVGSNIAIVKYDAKTATLSSLLQEINQALAGEQADSIGFAVHDAGDGRFALTQDEVVSIVSLVTSNTQQDFWSEVGGLVNENGRIDILACNLTATESGQLLVNELEHITGVNVAASNDITGNAEVGGDWTLETDDVDVAAAYFSRPALQDFEGALAAPTFTGMDTTNDSQTYSEATEQGTDKVLEVNGDVSTALNSSTEGWSDGAGLGTLEVYFDGTVGTDINADDILDWQDGGGLTLSGGNISNGVNTIATLDSIGDGSTNDGSTSLLITFDNTNEPTDAEVTQILKNIVYSNSSDTPLAATKNVHWILEDGDGNFSTADSQVVLTDANDAPTISNLGAADNFTYNEGDGAVVLDHATAAALADVDSTDLDSGNLTVTIAANEDAAEDVIAIDTSGTVSLSAGTTVGSVVSVGGTAIGTISADGAGGNDLVVDFDQAAGNATVARVQTLVQAITYENTDTDNPTANTRTVRFTVSDGDGGTSANADVDVTVQGVNDAPTPANHAFSTKDLDTHVLTTADLKVNDVDNTDTQLTYTIRAGGLPSNGNLQKNTGSWVTLAAGDSFTQQDIIDGKVRYVHTNSGTTTDTVNFDVDDSATGTISDYQLDVSITDNETPVAVDREHYITFDGTNDHIELTGESTFDFNNGDTFAVEFWFRPDRVTGTQVLVGKGDNNMDPANFRIILNGSTIEFATKNDTAGYTTASSAISVVAGRWYHVAAVFDGSVRRLYVNGDSTTLGGTSASHTTLATNNNNVTIGASRDGSLAFQGAIDDVRIWDDVRSQAQIKANMSSTLTGAESGLLALIKNEDAAASTTAIDSAGNDNNGSLHLIADPAASRVFETEVNEDATLDLRDRLFVYDFDVPSGNDIKVTISSAQGTLNVVNGIGALTSITGNSSVSVQLLGTVDEINACLSGIQFTGNADFNGAATVNVLADDLDNTGNPATPGKTVSRNYGITVNAVNDAPVLATAPSPTLTAIDEDNTTSAGSSVGSIVVDGSITDVDGAAVEAIAITAADNSNGTWQYKIGAGAWTNVNDGSLAEGHALLLDTADLLRFVPNADWNGAADFTFRAWDKTSGSAGNYVDTSTNGNTTAYSVNTDTASITVNPVNDAPVLDNSKTPVLNAVNEDAGAPSGAVGTLISDLVDIGGALSNVTDIDASTITGIAIYSANTTNGTWHYTIDGGTSWNPLGAVTAGSARLLADNASTRLYFQPNADFSGTVSSAISFRAWDQTSGANGGSADVSTNGGTTAFSTAVDSANITVDPVADTPSITGASTNEDTQTSSGLVISRNAVDGTEVTHFKITNISGGTLYQNDGSTQISNGDFITFAQGNAGLKFTPSQDSTANGNFDVQASTGNNDAGLGGNVVTAAITVAAQNDSPVNNYNGSPFAGGESQTTDEDSALVFSAGNSNQIQLTDVDDAGGTMQMTLTVSHGTLTLGQTTGLDFAFVGDADGNPAGDGASDASMTFRGSKTDINAAIATLTYNPDSDYHGADTLTITSKDLGNAGAGGTLSDSDSVAITVSPDNDATVIDSITATSYTKGNPPIDLADLAEISDVDDVELEKIEITITSGYVEDQDFLLYDDGDDKDGDGSNANDDGVPGGGSDDIHVSFNKTTGVLTLFGNPAVNGGRQSYATFQTALRQVRFQNTTDLADGSYVDKVIQYKITDLSSSKAGDFETTTLDQDVRVNGSPLPPVDPPEPPPPPPVEADTSSDSSTTDTGAEGGDAGGSDAGGNTGDSSGTSTIGDVTSDQSEQNGGSGEDNYDSNLQTDDSSDSSAGDNADIQAMLEGASEGELALAAIQHADEVLKAADKDLADIFTNDQNENIDKFPLISFDEIYLTLKTRFSTLRQAVIAARDALRSTMQESEAAGDAADVILQDVIAVRTDALQHVSDELEIFTNLIDRANQFLLDNPGITPLQLKQKLEKLRAEILREIAERQSEPDAILKDAAAAYLQKKRAAEK